MGFSGIQNFPTVGLYDGTFRANLEETGMGFQKEARGHSHNHGPSRYLLRMRSWYIIYRFFSAVENKYWCTVALPMASIVLIQYTSKFSKFEPSPIVSEFVQWYTKPLQGGGDGGAGPEVGAVDNALRVHTRGGGSDGRGGGGHRGGTRRADDGRAVSIMASPCNHLKLKQMQCAGWRRRLQATDMCGFIDLLFSSNINTAC